MLLQLEQDCLDIFEVLLMYLDDKSFRHLTSTCKTMRDYCSSRRLNNVYNVSALRSSYWIPNIDYYFYGAANILANHPEVYHKIEHVHIMCVYLRDLKHDIPKCLKVIELTPNKCSFKCLLDEILLVSSTIQTIILSEYNRKDNYIPIRNVIIQYKPYNGQLIEID